MKRRHKNIYWIWIKLLVLLHDDVGGIQKQVYGQHIRLISFIKDNADTFLMRDNAEEGGRAEVILLRSEGEDAAVTEPPAGTAGKNT